MQNKHIILFLISLLAHAHSMGQTGSSQEPVRYIGGEIANPNVHDGALRYTVGVENIQVMRANRTNKEAADDFGWTYNHAPNLGYWKGKFYLQYLSNPVGEHEDPGHTMLVISKDGRNWNKPQELFPPYPAPAGVKIPEGYKGYMMHQRMGFYTSPNGKLLTLAFYGHTEHPFKEGGIGRVVREIKDSGQLGPIYFIRYTSHAHWDSTNTAFPFYKTAPDKSFVDACDALLADKLTTLQWWDEDRGMDGFYTFKDTTDNMEAPSIYHRKDGKTVALWKNSFATLSADEGKSWSKPQIMPSLIMPGSKNWGQRTTDGRYAMSYNPISTQEYRYPLIVTSSDDGILFDDMGVVHGEVPPRRFFGRWKDFGPNYVRGITEEETPPPGNNMWIVYSVNKEDIWISRIPLPIHTEVKGPVLDQFDHLNTNGTVTNWNIYSPKWASISIDNYPGQGNKSLRLDDEDPYDYARAIRVFESGENKHIIFKLNAAQNDHGNLQVDITDRHGSRPVRILFEEDGQIKLDNGTEKRQLMPYLANKWYTFDINVSTVGMGTLDLAIDGNILLRQEPLAEKVKEVQRISFRTGDYRQLPNRKTPNQVSYEPLEGADNRAGKVTFHLDDVYIK